MLIYVLFLGVTTTTTPKPTTTPEPTTTPCPHKDVSAVACALLGQQCDKEEIIKLCGKTCKC